MHCETLLDGAVALTLPPKDLPDLGVLLDNGLSLAVHLRALFSERRPDRDPRRQAERLWRTAEELEVVLTAAREVHNRA